MRMETALAKASLTRVDKRDPYKLYHSMTRAELQALTPSLPLGRLPRERSASRRLEHVQRHRARILQGARTAAQDEQPGRPRRPTCAGTWRATRRPISPPPSSHANFDFYSTYLRGVRSRFRRAGSAASAGSTATWARRWARSSSARPSRRRSRPTTLDMTRADRAGHGAAHPAAPLDEPGDQEAGAGKLHTMRDKIGYPDRWRDYSALDVKRGDFAGNVERARRFESRRTSPRSASRSTAASGG